MRPPRSRTSRPRSSTPVPETRSPHHLPTPPLPSLDAISSPHPKYGYSPFPVSKTPWPLTFLPPPHFSSPLAMDLISIPLLLLVSFVSGGGDIFFPSPCGELCGDLSLPYPFHINSSCGPPVDAFRLTCSQNHSSNPSLYLTLGHTDLRVIAFFSSTALLLDYSKFNSPSTPSSCNCWFADLNDSVAVLDRSPFFAVTVDNVFRLYDCNDSSVCRPGCERVGWAAATKGCDGAGAPQECCYPLSDGSMYKVGQGFSGFAEYGCRGFSSWVAPQRLDGVVRRGIEVEWAVPRRLAEVMACVDGAVAVNATAVKGGTGALVGRYLLGMALHRDRVLQSL